ncbi:MAG: Flp pilus assembly complex ATPase component TadA [Treponema sp.]|jgi:type IV secretion system protein VirB11|nr:Flp pilus assembly complex ATPase component TadA [Treponema sp.]
MGRIEDELEKQKRNMTNLLADLEKLIPFFETKTVTDIYVYGTGNVYVEDFYKGSYDTGVVLSLSERIRIIYSLSSVVDIPIDKWVRPTLESIIPKYNIRTTAIIDPWLAAPEITFRRPAEKIHTFEDYLSDGKITQELYDKIISHIGKRSNIVISGATGSGKTTFTNACIEKMCEFTPNERIYIVEDTPELQCRSPFKTQLYIRKEQAVIAIQTALRWTPKRIIFGEIRSGEVAVELLEAWNTGHPGNVTTIHADNAASTIPRIEGLLRQIIKGQLPDLAESIHLIVHLKNKSVVEALTIREIREGKKMT